MKRASRCLVEIKAVDGPDAVNDVPAALIEAASYSVGSRLRAISAPAERRCRLTVSPAGGLVTIAAAVAAGGSGRRRGRPADMNAGVDGHANDLSAGQVRTVGEAGLG